MMISPESYYELYLKDKTKEEIHTTIRGLKQSIGRLINKMEHPDYDKLVKTCPSDDVRVSCDRMYLERAIIALNEAGGTYIPSQKEIKTEAVNARLNSLAKIELEIGGFLNGSEKITVTIDGNKIIRDIEHSIIPKPSNIEPYYDEDMTSTELIEALCELYIGEWRHHYSLERFGYMVLDGTQWSLTLSFSDGQRCLKYYGDNAYPYNFEKLLELLGIEYSIHDEVDEDDCE